MSCTETVTFRKKDKTIRKELHMELCAGSVNPVDIKTHTHVYYVEDNEIIEGWVESEVNHKHLTLKQWRDIYDTKETFYRISPHPTNIGKPFQDEIKIIQSNKLFISKYFAQLSALPPVVDLKQEYKEADKKFFKKKKVKNSTKTPFYYGD